MDSNHSAKKFIFAKLFRYYVCYPTTEEAFYGCGIQRKRVSSIVRYNRRGFFRCGIQRKRCFSVVEYNGANDTTQNDIFKF
jgi:hypothetical protein